VLTFEFQGKHTKVHELTIPPSRPGVSDPASPSTSTPPHRDQISGRHVVQRAVGHDAPHAANLLDDARLHDGAEALVARDAARPGEGGRLAAAVGARPELEHARLPGRVVDLRAEGRPAGDVVALAWGDGRCGGGLASCVG
jgi:hypothetical protein